MDSEHQTDCHLPDCGVRVPRPDAPAIPLCFDHSELMAQHIQQSSGLDRDAAIADFRRRVLGLDGP